MEFIAHRINTIDELGKIDDCYGVELDLRDDTDGSIYIMHDPFTRGEAFEGYLKEYHHGTMILNIKSERIEHRVLDLIRKYDIDKYFFLDSSFPMIKELADMGEKNIAIRYSEYEGMETIVNMKGKVNWVWVDTFSRLPLDDDTYSKLKDMGYRICLVSPELQGKPEKIEKYARDIVEHEYKFDAICTKMHNIIMWKKLLDTIVL